MHAWATPLPGGAGILYLSVTLPTEMSRIVHVPLSGTPSTDVIAADAIVGYSEPFLLFVRRGDIYAVRFDPGRLRVSGEPRRVVEHVAYNADVSSAFASVTPDGVLVFPPRTAEKRRLVWYDREGTALGTVLEDEDIRRRPRISSDGKRLLVTKFMTESGSEGVVRVDLLRGTRTLLTPPPRFGFDALWLPDGERFVFTSSRRTADHDLFVQLDDPQAQPVPFWEGRSEVKGAVGLTPDGAHLIAHEFLPETGYDIWLVPLDRPEARKPLLNSPANEYWADVSPDGRWLAYSSNASGPVELYVRPTEGGRSIQVSTTGGMFPRWSPDGHELFFASGDRAIMGARVVRRAGAVDIDLPKRLFLLDRHASLQFELRPDGKAFLVNELAEAESAVRPYSVLTGWKEALER